MYRGGTSRGLLFLEDHLPYSRDVLAPILLRAFGSPDVRQIDGVGGGTSLTSKALIVGAEPTAVAAPTVDWGGNCGNMTSAVGPFAIDSGLVPASDPVTIVNIRSLNTGTFVRAHVPVRGGRVCTEGSYAIAGVRGTAARIDLEWLEPGGTTTGRLLPTGKVREEFVLSGGRRIEVSIVDAANPMVFCKATSLGLKGTELPAALESNTGVLQLLEEIRSMAAEVLGIASRDEATKVSPGLPKVAFVAPPAPYLTTSGEALAADTHDFQGRYVTMQTPHRAYAGGGAICTGAAALIAGTVVNECVPHGRLDLEHLRIGHPAGVMDVRVKMRGSGTDAHVLSATVARTARRIMSGAVWVPESLVPQTATARAAGSY